MEGVHEGLANVQYGHSHVRGLREPHLFLGHVDGRQIFVNNSERLEVRLGGESLELPAVRDELDVLMFSDVFLNDETTTTKNTRKRVCDITTLLRMQSLGKNTNLTAEFRRLQITHHGLSEDAVVHEFEKIFFKLIRRFLSLVGVEVDVRLQPPALGERNDAVNFLHPHAKPHVQLEVSVVQGIPLLAFQRAEQLAATARLDAQLFSQRDGVWRQVVWLDDGRFRAERVVAVRSVQLFRILEIDFEDVPFGTVVGHRHEVERGRLFVQQEVELFFRKAFAHRRAVEVVPAYKKRMSYTV